jgi:hypothetical protein
VKYTFSSGTTGNGTVSIGGTPIALGTYVPISLGATIPSFKSTGAGTVILNVEVKDSNGTVKNSPITFTVTNVDFNLSSSGDGTLNINTLRSFNVFLSQVTADASSSYEVRYTFSSGTTATGEVYKEGVKIPLAVYAPIALGGNSLNFKGLSSGVVNLMIEVKDNNNLVHTSTVVFNVNQIDYTFTGAAQSNSIFVNGTTPINFDVTESAASGATFEMKYVVTSGTTQIKNGANTENTNVWYPVNVGSFSRTLVGTDLGTITILFTVRNTTTLVEKTQSITVNVIPSTFTFNAANTSNNQVINTPVNINLNILQTGGTGDAYNFSFTTSGTGTFTYNGVTYTAGQIIPFVAGVLNGTYTGSVSGKHDINFTVTNQLNTSKSSVVSLTYINNNFTLSTTGDGTILVNNPKDFNIFIAQANPDPSITYEVKYSFDSGTVGNGQILSGGVSVSLGSYSAITTGNSLLSFKGTTAGIINLLVEVKNSNGLLKSSVIMFNVKNTDFTFTGGSSNNAPFVNESNPLNFNLTEAEISGTSYEMSYSFSSGNGSVKDAGSTINAYQWYDISTGSFTRDLTVLTGGNFVVVFSVRNKTTLQTKTVTITVDAYQKPTLTNIRTWHIQDNSQGCFNGCEYDYRYLFKYDLTLESGATLKSIVFNITPLSSTPINITLASFPIFSNGFITLAFYGDSNARPSWNYRTYSLVVTDSNNISTTISGLTFTDNQTDSQ